MFDYDTKTFNNAKSRLQYEKNIFYAYKTIDIVHILYKKYKQLEDLVIKIVPKKNSPRYQYTRPQKTNYDWWISHSDK